MSLSAPIKYRQDQNVFISSNIELNCSTYNRMTSEWTISSCNSSCTILSSFEPQVIRTFSEIFIPARILVVGIYELRYTVRMSHAYQLVSSNIVYIQITPREIRGKMLPFEISMITRGYEQDIKLDPGQYSIDSVHSIFNATVRCQR
jgi:hypothetical protein